MVWWIFRKFCFYIVRLEKSTNLYRFTGIKGGVSPKHDAITISAIYNLGSGRVARTIFENMKAMKALFDRNSDAYQKAVHEEYRKKDRNERIENELNFFNQ